MDDYITKCSSRITFMKINPDFKALKNEKYELTSIDGKTTSGIYTKREEYGDYHIFIEEYEEKDLAILLPTVIKDLLANIQTQDDFSIFQENSDIFKEVTHGYTINNYLEIDLSVPFRLKQIKTSPGMQKTDIVILGNCNLQYYYDDTGAITKKQITVSISDYHNDNILYANDIPEVNELADLAQFTPQQIERSCLNTDNQGKIITNPSGCTKQAMINGSFFYDLVPYFISQPGEVKFKVESTVNGQTKYNASKGKDLKYSIKVTNTGNAASDNNQVISYLPKEITLNKNTISHNGTYNKNENTITWNINHMEAEEIVELSYEATAPNEISTNELISNASISSDYLERTTYSNNAIVTLDKIEELLTNPETGQFIRSFITNTVNYVSIIAIVTLLITVLMYKKGKAKN